MTREAETREAARPMDAKDLGRRGKDHGPRPPTAAATGLRTGGPRLGVIPAV